MKIEDFTKDTQIILSFLMKMHTKNERKEITEAEWLVVEAAAKRLNIEV